MQNSRKIIERDRFWIQPIHFNLAARFIEKFHSYQAAPVGCKFCIQINLGPRVCGVAVVGRPISREADDGFTAELTRLCIRNNFADAASFGASRAWRISKALGYRKLITYVASDKEAKCLIAAGFKKVSSTPPKKWHGKQPSKIAENLRINRFEISDSTPRTYELPTPENIADLLAERTSQPQLFDIERIAT